MYSLQQKCAYSSIGQSTCLRSRGFQVRVLVGALTKKFKDTAMKEREKIISSYEEYQERKKWARETAKEFGITLDEGGEHFVISPIYDPDGKLISRVMLSVRHDEIPLTDKEGKVQGQISIQGAIWLTKHYPDFSLREAAEERMKWAQKIAAELKITFDKDRERFVIDGLNAKGKKNQRELSLWKEVLVKTVMDGKETTKIIPIETIIEEMRRFPGSFFKGTEEVIEELKKGTTEGLNKEEEKENNNQGA